MDTPETATVEVTQSDNERTVELTEWLIGRDVFFEDGPPELEKTMNDFGDFADELFARHRTRATRQDGLREARERFLDMIADAREWEEDQDEGGIYYTLKTTDVSLVPLMNALGIEQQITSLTVDDVGTFPGIEMPSEAIERVINESAAPSDSSPLANETGALREAATDALKCLRLSVQSFPDVERKLAAALSASPEGEGK